MIDIDELTLTKQNNGWKIMNDGLFLYNFDYLQTYKLYILCRYISYCTSCILTKDIHHPIIIVQLMNINCSIDSLFHRCRCICCICISKGACPLIVHTYHVNVLRQSYPYQQDNTRQDNFLKLHFKNEWWTLLLVAYLLCQSYHQLKYSNNFSFKKWCVYVDAGVTARPKYSNLADYCIA